jgi:hypothetical protein
MEQPGRNYTDPRGGAPSQPGRGFSNPRGGKVLENPARGGDILHQPGRSRRPGVI